MLSPHNVHRNAARIHKFGADSSQLSNVMRVEIAPFGQIRGEQLSKNRALIDRSVGLLAPINGSERRLSLGCGRTVACCKTAALGGRTSQKALQVIGGDTIVLQKVRVKREFNKMIDDGWAWEIVPRAVDAAYPQFAIVAQEALNTQKHIGTGVGELEARVTLVGSLRDHGFKLPPNWRELAVQSAQSLNVPSAQHCDALLEFVLNYGGGGDAPMICFVDGVECGCNLNMGSTFWHALTYMSFSCKTKAYPLIRVALALANMTGDEVEDGAARPLVKSDARRITPRKQMTPADKAEDIFDQVVTIAQPVGGVDKFLEPLGQLFARVGLRLTDKENAIVGQKVECADWGNGSESPVGETTAPSTKPPKKQATSSAIAAAATLDDHKSASFIAATAGFKVGSFAQQRGIETAGLESIFVIISIGDTVELHQVRNYSRTPGKASVGLDTFLTEWLVSKQGPPEQMDDGQMRPTPLQVRTASGIAKDQPALVPVASMANITTKASSQGSSIPLGENKLNADQDAVSFFVSPLAKPSSVARANWFEPDSLMAVFWWVGTTADETKANVALGAIMHNVVKIPVLKNTVNLAPSTKLRTNRAPRAKPVPILDTDAAKSAFASWPLPPRSADIAMQCEVGFPREQIRQLREENKQLKGAPQWAVKQQKKAHDKL
ncbi:unnamed protein product [Prorocentrum cordatum]|uniref:Uncharacterized protein n=1 Tax=Prorocentrum cordatum TaxID=2364126 RepID=A0ABN9Q821_9DINO|nr:unnamed protein product [Polarella glacialis]